MESTVGRLEEEGHEVPITHVDGCVYQVGSKQAIDVTLLATLPPGFTLCS